MLNRPLTIACVLKTGGEVYNHRYVNALASAIKRHVTVPHTMVCLTDDPTGFNDAVDEVVKLKHNFAGWWSKIELFRPDLFAGHQVFFLDLDTVIIDNIDQIVQCSHPFSGLRDFYGEVSLGSGLMSWEQGRLNRVYGEFMESPFRAMKTVGGDQTWIDPRKPSIKYLQDLYPGKIVSFKKHCMKGSTKNVAIPGGASIVCFHGVPKPHSILHPSIADHWI